MANLTPKQKAFADEYIINGGNATQAAIKAGYSKKTAGRIAGQNLKKLEIVKYMASKVKPIEEERDFSIEDAMNNLIDLLTGKPITSQSKQIDHLQGNKLVKDMTYQYSADPDQRIKALDIYFKVTGAYDKKEPDVNNEPITIVDEWSDSDE
ncbi:phage terminase small subunit [Enterococcus sp. AZ135]|uniref:terminase small subunit n=1 Tax=unclassified Enterococcus TaxID=2608891 RepID=UPI003F292E38